MSDSTSNSSADYVLLTRLADEFAARFRAGERPSLREYIDRYPELADDIRELLPAMIEIERVKAGPQEAPDLGATRTDPVARQLGDFRILREVGKGGMGIVYEAEQLSLGRHVALKLLPRNMLLDARAKRRFEREAKSAARLHHTNIVPVFGVGEQDGMPYYVMQFIRGLGLDDVLEELKNLQAGGAKAGSRLGGDPLGSRDAGRAPDGPGEAGDPKSPTHRAMSAVNVARSLLTGEFHAPPGPDDATDPLNAEVAGGARTTATPEGAVDRASETTIPRLPAASDPFALSSSSLSLPGQGPDGSGARNRKRTYWQSVASMGAQVAEALEYAHKQGIQHRDIKPSNLLLDAQGTVWVADFGLAKADDQQNLTHTGDILGTLRYMPPEAFDGKTDTRSDVYSLGLTLYEMLAFRSAFDEKERNRLIKQVTEAEPERLGKLNRHVPQDLQTIVHKAIEKDPARRYSSAGAMAADLRRFIEDEPIQARRLGQLERLGRWSRRHKAVAALLATLATVLTVGFLAMAVLWTRAERSADAARRNERTAKDLAAKEEKARNEALALAAKERKARGEADEKAEQLAREDYINRVNRAYREIQDDNIALAEDLLHGCEPGRRGWEWHFVERLCNSERRVIDVGNSSVNALAYSPDGIWAVSGSGENPIHTSGAETPLDVWDVSSGRRLKNLTGAKGTIYTVVVSPDGKKIAAGFSDGLVAVWDVATGASVWTRKDPGLNAMSVAFNPDGKSLAAGYGSFSGSQVGRAKVWDLESGREIKTFPGPVGGVNRLAFHPDGKRLALAGSEVVEIRDLETGDKLQDLKGHAKWVYCLAYSPDGRWLATGGWDNTVKLRDAATGVEALTIFAHEGFVLDLAFSPDSRTLVTSSEDRSVRLWEVPSGRRSATFHGQSDFVWAAAFRPDGREVATGSLDGSIRFWDLGTSRPVLIRHTGWVDRFAFRRDGLRVLSESGNYRTDALPTKGWSPVTGELDATLDGTSFDRLPADFLRGPLGYMERINSNNLSITSPDGRLVASSGEGAGGGESSRSKEYSASSTIIREAETGRVIQTLAGHSADVVSLGFSPDGRRLATASFDRTIKLWDTTTWQDVFTLRGHTAGVVSLAFSPDGTRIVSGGIDFTARVWNATPLAPEVIAEHDARCRKKVETLARLKGTTDESKRAEILAAGGQWGVAAEAFAKAVTGEPGKLRLRYQLIDALLKSGDFARVAPACDEMLARFGSSNDHLLALGVAGFCRLARMAIADPSKLQVAHDLAGATNDNARLDILSKSGQWDLITEYRAGIVKDKPDDSGARFHLGFALAAQGKLDEASAAYREHLRLSPDSDFGHNNLGVILNRQGRLDEAIASVRKAVELKPSNEIAQNNLVGLLGAREIQGKLPSFLKGEYRPKDNVGRRGLADLCQGKKLYQAGARLFADAFAEDPKLADDLKSADRYNAACFACLAAAGRGEDSAKLDDAERARLRRQALDWLRADLTLWTRRVQSVPPADRPETQRMLSHWQVDGDLAGIRDEAALAKLPEAERKEWEGLWEDVKALLERTQRQTP